MAAKRVDKKKTEEKQKGKSKKSGKINALMSWAKSNAFLIVVFALACMLMFPNLGDRIFWGDEAAFVEFAEKVVEKGYPSTNGLEGINEALDNPLVHKPNGVYTYHPWLTFYVISAPVALFGEYNEFAIRFPFAVFGIISILMVYFLALEFGLSNKAAKIATILALTSTALLLHSRNANYYSLAVLLSLFIIYLYLKFIKEEKMKYAVLFTITSVLFFYTQFLMFADLMVGISLHFAYTLFFWFKQKEDNKKNIIKKAKYAAVSLLCILLLTLPWLIFADISKQAGFINVRGILFNNIVGWFLIFVFAFPLIFVLFIPSAFKKLNKNQNLLLIPIVVIVTIGVMSLNSMTPPTMRYLLALFPLLFILLGSIIANISEKSRVLAVLLVIVLITSNLLFIFPFFMFKEMAQKSLDLRGYPAESEKRFLDNTLSPKSYFALYIYEIAHDYKSPASESIEYINSKKDPSKAGSQQIFTNNDEVSHGFYTGMNATANYSKLCSQTFDWISLNEKKANTISNNCFNPNQYDLFELKNNEDDWADAPDLVNHQFITGRSGTISIYKLKE